MNPADLQFAMPGPDGAFSATGLGVSGLTNGIGMGKSGKTIASSVPRIDTEPIYVALKTCIGDRWADYKGALSGFLLGKLNQTEMTAYLTPILLNAGLPPLPPLNFNTTIPHFLSTSPTALHLHNLLLASLYANALYRDPPSEAQPHWVTSADAPTSASNAAKGASGLGNEVDDRNKREVMALAARDRRRIKAVKDDPLTAASLSGGLAQAERYHHALSATSSAVLHNLGSSAPSFQPTSLSARSGGDATNAANNSTSTSTLGGKTNVDLEIKRRFALPLASETSEFPLRDNIAARIEPIAYEEGLAGAGSIGSGGAGSGSGNAAGAAASSSAAAASALAELLETGLEHYVKELVSGVFRATRSNGGGGSGAGHGGSGNEGGVGATVCTASWRKRYRAEEESADAAALRAETEANRLIAQGIDSGAAKAAAKAAHGTGRDALGRLGVEVESAEKRRGLDGSDLRLALRLDRARCGDRFLGALLVEDEDVVRGLEVEEEAGPSRAAAGSVGPMGAAESKVNAGLVNGDGGGGAGGPWRGGWVGSSDRDRANLMDVLGGALAVG